VVHQHKLVIEVLRRLHEHTILEKVLLIGSWCALFYKDYFKDPHYNPRIMTRDIDILVPRGVKFSEKLDLESIMEDLGFELEFAGPGYMRLESDQLMVEFLVPLTGRAEQKPYKLPEISFNAQPLRHLKILWRQPVKVAVADFSVHLPHPADYIFNKLIVSGKRKSSGKNEKDRDMATSVLEAMQTRGKLSEVSRAYQELTKKEQKSVRQSLELTDHSEWLPS
jgi:hypothetical protein